jgi:hypothetical protein
VRAILQMYETNPRAMSIMMLNLSRLLASRLKKADVELKELRNSIKKVA